MEAISTESKNISNIENAGIEVSKINENDIAFWTRPVKIKELWYNAILQKPQPTKKNNIQFIMRCKMFGAKETSYIVVSRDPMTLEEINKIDLNDYIFGNQSNFSKGVNYVCE